MGHKPKSKSKHLGIEIEFISKLDRKEANKLLSIMGMNKWCDIVGDISIDLNDGREAEADSYSEYDDYGNYIEDEQSEFGLELRILATQQTLKAKLILVKKFLKHAALYVNESCGLHVHLDMRNRNLEKAVNRLLDRQSEFRQMVPEHRRNNEDFCGEVKKEELYRGPVIDHDEYGYSIYEKRNTINPNNSPRYKDINVQAYSKYKTVEVRIHEATLDTKDIYNWCNYLINVVDGKGKQIDKRYVNKRIKMCA